jgi:hypothetical protein
MKDFVALLKFLPIFIFNIFTSAESLSNSSYIRGFLLICMFSSNGTSAPMSESLLLHCKSGFEVVELEPAFGSILVA